MRTPSLDDKFDNAPNVCVCAKSTVFVYFKEDNLGEGVYLDIIILTNSS